MNIVLTWRNALRDSDLDRTAKLVGFVLSTYMDAGTGEAWPAKTKLAQGASLGRGEGWKDNTAVSGAIDRLEAAGLLTVDRRRGRRGFLYTAVIPRDYVGFAGDESHAAPWDNDTLNPTRNGAKSHADVVEIPRRGVGEHEEHEEHVTTTRARARGKKNRANAQERDYEEYNRA